MTEHSAHTFDTPKGRAAHCQPRDYPYIFPKSQRNAGGSMNVRAAVDKLAIAYHFHHQLMRVLAGSLIRVGEFELKIELAHHLYFNACAAKQLRVRLEELRMKSSQLDTGIPTHVVIICNELEQANGSTELIVGLHGVINNHLRAFEQEYIQSTDTLVDLPSIRVLRQILIDLDEMIIWGIAVEKAFLQGGYDTNELTTWRTHLEEVVGMVGGIAGKSEGITTPICLRQEQSGPYTRPLACARDERLSTFHHTRRYTAFADKDNQLQSYEARRIEMLQVQRDELDAIETFANTLYDLPKISFDFEMVLARFIWDEARHAEMGQQSLAHLGLDPFAVPCGIIGINARSPLPPVLAFVQINTFGELNQIGDLKALSIEAYKHGDFNTGRCFDFVHADELMHVRKGREWLCKLSKELKCSVPELQEKARVAAVKRLHEEGVLDEDYGPVLTPRELALMIGE